MKYKLWFNIDWHSLTICLRTPVATSLLHQQQEYIVMTAIRQTLTVGIFFNSILQTKTYWPSFVTTMTLTFHIVVIVAHVGVLSEQRGAGRGGDAAADPVHTHLLLQALDPAWALQADVYNFSKDLNCCGDKMVRQHSGKPADVLFYKLINQKRIWRTVEALRDKAARAE